MTEVVYNESGGSNDGRPSFADDFASATKSHNEGAFDRAPEKREQVEDDPTAPLREAALGIAVHGVQVGEAVGELLEDSADALVYAGPEEIASRLLAAGGGARLEDYLSSWADSDPYAAQAWTDQTLHATAARAYQAEAVEAAQASQKRLTQYQQVTDAFQRRHRLEEGTREYMLVEAAIAEDPRPDDSPEAWRQKLERGKALVENTLRAEARANGVRDLKNAFRQPQAADLLKGRPWKAPLPEVDADDITSRMQPPPEVRQAERAARQEEFFAEFRRTAGGSGFGQPRGKAAS